MDEIPSMLWDYIFVGGGLSASVVSHRLHEFNPELKILVVEAGPNANNRSDIVWPNSTNLIGGDFDWKYVTVNQSNLNDRRVSLPCGKALGGGTVINSNGWLRGDQDEYDLWGSMVRDARWSYAGLLPFMKKSEHFHNETVDKSQRGLNGPSYIQSVTSTNREYPLRSRVLQSWAELGIEPLPYLDGNGGNTRGVGELQENRMNGRREISAQVYPLDGINVLTETLVEKILLETTPEGILMATGIQLRDDINIHGHEIIVSAGAVRTPQLLMVSGIGPAEELAKFNIPLFLDQPNVGKGLADHGMFNHAWKVKDPAAGWALGSANPLFMEPQYGWGTPADFVVASSVPNDGLIAAITEDEGAVPDPSTHPLLCKSRSFIEHVFLYTGASNGSLVTFAAIMLLPTSRGSVKLASADINDYPLIDPNYLGTAVDRYIVREGVKMQIKFAGSNATIIGREILESEAGTPGFDEVLSVNSTDQYIDARVRAGIGSAYHPMGTAAMGSVVDTDLKVEGVDNLRVVDTSVFPVTISGHLQVATFAMAEQAAEIIFASRGYAEKHP